jgi:hypothetical protein
MRLRKMRGGLPKHLRMLLLEGPRQCGSYDPHSVLGRYEEGLTAAEYQRLHQFLTWITANDLTYGRGTLDERWSAWTNRPSIAGHTRQ